MKSFILSLFLAGVSALPLKSTSSSSAAPGTAVRARAAGANASSWWYANVDHTSAAVRAYVPDLSTDDYPVYKAVASGDADGFRNALYSDGPNGERDNMWLAGQPRVVYLAPGTYTLSQTLYIDTDTVIMGDASDPPTIKAASGFNGQYMIVGGQDGDGNGGELHFSVQMKNLILDTTANSGTSDFAALSWRVAQNAGLNNIKIVLPNNAHTGIWMGQGSTISVGDVTVQNGNIGFHYAGHQQAQIKNFQFLSNTNGIVVDGGNTIQIFGCTFDTVGNPITVNSGAPWISMVDLTSKNSGTFFKSNIDYPNFMIENLSNDNPNADNVVVGGNTKVGAKDHIGTYIYGNTYGANPVYQNNPTEKTIGRPSNLAPNGNFPISSAPTYADKTVADVINLKDSSQNGGNTVHGDGDQDDTKGLQGAIETAASQGKIAFLPFGIYKVTGTLYIPPGTELVGEAWSTISGYGDAFGDESNPTPVVMVGKEGETGIAHIQDIRFTVGQQSPGAILVQVNMAGDNPGDVAIYNSLITIGGTRDTDLSCDIEDNCAAAYLGVHLSSTSSAYIDNFWSWVADHASDDSSKGTRTAGKGGMLVEATQGTWIVGLGSEHWWLYQLSYHNAANVFTSFFQSETNYHQNADATRPPAPFTPTEADADFSWCSGDDGACYMGPAQYWGSGNSNIYHYAAGSWNFFNGDQGNMNVIQSDVNNLQLHGLTTHTAAETLRLPDGTRFGAGDSDGFGGSWGTLVADYPDMAQDTPA